MAVQKKQHFRALGLRASSQLPGSASSIPLVLSIISTFHSLLGSPAVKIQFSSPLDYKLHIKLAARTREVRVIAVYVHMIMIIKAFAIFMAYK